MPRYAAFLRGVTPGNARMPDLVRAFQAAGFAEVRTLLSSGNVLFSAPRASNDSLERKAEAAMEQSLKRSFLTIVRSVDTLQDLIESDPFQSGRLTPVSKRVVTFLRRPPERVTLPIELDGARILAIRGSEAFTIYEPSPRGPVFMSLIEKTFGKVQTTRTWETVARSAR
jgi:uncharacterized protein (DUF1697 family)